LKISITQVAQYKSQPIRGFVLDPDRFGQQRLQVQRISQRSEADPPPTAEPLFRRWSADIAQPTRGQPSHAHPLTIAMGDDHFVQHIRDANLPLLM
jgi:hypothetical protein